MLYAEFKIPVKGVYQTFMAGQCLKGNGIDKIHSIFRHKHMDACSLLYQGAGQVCDLIGSNAARNSKEYGFSF